MGNGVHGRTALHTAALAHMGGVQRQLPGLTTTAIDQVQCMHDKKGDFPACHACDLYGFTT